MTAPYYQDEFVTLYHSDCRDLADVWLSADVLVTDPPYGIAFKSGWTGSEIANDETTEARDHVLNLWGDKPALVFGTPFAGRLAGEVARLVWWRRGSGMGNLDLPWQPDYEAIHVFGTGFAATTRGPSVLDYQWDVFRGDAGHPHRKPTPLLRDVIAKCPPGVVADPFVGSGSTLVAAKELGRQVVGVEVEEQYCELAASRCAQDVLFAVA